MPNEGICKSLPPGAAKFAAAAVCAFRAAVTSPMSALVPAPTAEAAAIFVKGIAIEGIDPVARRVVASKEVAGILWDRLRESRGHRKESEEEEKEVREKGSSTHDNFVKCPST